MKITIILPKVVNEIANDMALERYEIGRECHGLPWGFLE